MLLRLLLLPFGGGVVLLPPSLRVSKLLSCSSKQLSIYLNLALRYHSQMFVIESAEPGSSDTFLLLVLRDVSGILRCQGTLR